jgi:hypothetical protein
MRIIAMNCRTGSGWCLFTCMVEVRRSSQLKIHHIEAAALPRNMGYAPYFNRTFAYEIYYCGIDFYEIYFYGSILLQTVYTRP